MIFIIDDGSKSDVADVTRALFGPAFHPIENLFGCRDIVKNDVHPLVIKNLSVGRSL